MWTPENRSKYNRDKLRYPSDLTVAEWELIEPLLPPAKRGGRRRSVDVREVVNGILYQAAEKPDPGRRNWKMIHFPGGLAGDGDAGNGRDERFAVQLRGS